MKAAAASVLYAAPHPPFPPPALPLPPLQMGLGVSAVVLGGVGMDLQQAG